MSAIRLLGFDGLVPKTSPTLLGENFAQVALNVKLYSGELRYWRGPELTYTPPPGEYETLYRLFHTQTETAFLLWEGNVDVAISPAADTSRETRIYYTGDGPPKKTNWAMATGGAEPYPSTWLPMGVTPPQAVGGGPAPPTLVLTTSGTGTVETRSYVYTHVQTFGAIKAESAPSAAAEINAPINGSTVTVSGFVPVPAGESITHRRIYRTVVGDTTVTYQFVAEITVATTSYADSKTAAQVGPDLLGTIGWLPPPNDLAGLVALPSGTLAGFVGNTVYFSEPYFPQAWPLAYAITLPVREIIGLGVTGSSLVVMTTTNPFFIHGGFPGEMYTEKIPLQEPCVAKTTIAFDEDGVIYASPNGLVLISPGARGIVTGNLFTTDEWRPLVPQSMHAAVLQGRYFGVFPNTNPSRAIILSRTDPPALSMMELPAQALHVDAVNGFLFYVHDVDHGVYQLDADEGVPMQFQWKSKRFFVDKAQTFSLLRLDADYSQVTDEAKYQQELQKVLEWNAAHYGQDLMGSINAVPIHGSEGDPITGEGQQAFDVNGSILRNKPRRISSRSVQVILYGDNGEVRATLTPTSLDPIRVPPFKAREMEFAILGNLNVRSLHMATTMEELLAS